VEKQIRVWFDKDTHAVLSAIAKKGGNRTIGSVVREIIEKWLVDNRYLPAADNTVDNGREK
jgi:hypothetical protein